MTIYVSWRVYNNTPNYTPITINYTRVELMINSTLQTIAYFVLIQRVSNYVDNPDSVELNP